MVRAEEARYGALRLSAAGGPYKERAVATDTEDHAKDTNAYEMGRL